MKQICSIMLFLYGYAVEKYFVIDEGSMIFYFLYFCCFVCVKHLWYPLCAWSIVCTLFDALAPCASSMT